MNNEQMLKAIIEKAVKNGFDHITGEECIKLLSQVFSYEEGKARDMFIRGFLFDKDFAKAYFGDKYMNLSKRQKAFTRYYEAWKYHLMHAVLADDIIEYYYQNI